MLKPIVKITLLSLLSALVGCSSVGSSVSGVLSSIQAGYDETIRKAQERRFEERSDEAMAFAKKLCEVKSADLTGDARKNHMDWCLDYVYTNVMLKKYGETSDAPAVKSNPVQSGQKVYRPDECTGPVINGECHGAVIPKGYVPTCYGTMLNGQCTGPMF
ncbi:hypothetical protein [Endozoicomonas sp. SESOKO2]|uniref:hypothetical protein n=1 Tax=Endozoicomonas sp. SESOKO2 TaxID=2828743 RepID=UPI0021481CDC|nr:hypothetical protein [Endozoicomonas sp. SESOKO2]